MIPAQKDITVRFGDTASVFFRVHNRVFDTASNSYVLGDYRDLTGYTITAQVRQNYADAAPLFSFTVSLGNQADTVSGRGSVLLKASPTVTGGIRNTNLRTGLWDCQFASPDGDVYTFVEGSVTFTQDVTR